MRLLFPLPLKIQVALLFQLVQTLAVLPGGQQSDTCSEEKGHRKPDQPQVVATEINRDVTVTQYHLLRNNGCRKYKQRHNENHSSRHLVHVSRKITLQNHASRLAWKSRFTRKKLAISHFTGNEKGRSRVTKLYPLPPSMKNNSHL